MITLGIVATAIGAVGVWRLLFPKKYFSVQYFGPLNQIPSVDSFQIGSINYACNRDSNLRVDVTCASEHDKPECMDKLWSAFPVLKSRPFEISTVQTDP
ncbi:hypothetical protein OAM67_00110 [bacterium]|nr:hypothetical protein [bacterium]